MIAGIVIGVMKASIKWARLRTMNENELYELKQKIKFPNSATANYQYYRKTSIDEWCVFHYFT